MFSHKKYNYQILELPPEAAMRPICMQGRDDTRHFIGACPAFARERAKLQQQVRTNMFHLGKPGALVLSQLQDDPEAWFDTVLGAKMRIKLPNRHQRTLRAPLAQVDLHSHNVREFWEPWLPYLRSYRPRQYKKNRRKNYFRVWEGQTTGGFL